MNSGALVAKGILGQKRDKTMWVGQRQGSSSAAVGKEFADRSIGLIDRHICVGAGTRIGIRDGNSAKGLASFDPGLFALFPFRRIKAERRVGVTMRPAVYGDSGDVRCRSETATAKHAAELFADVALQFGKRSLEKLVAPSAILISDGQTRFARSSQHEEHGRLFGPAWKFILSETYGEVERSVGVVASRRDDLVNTQSGKRDPVP